MSNVQSIIDKFEKSPENDPKIFKIISLIFLEVVLNIKVKELICVL